MEEGVKTMSHVLTDYEKGYLDGLLSGTSSAGKEWTEVYEKMATEYLTSIGCEGWSVNVSRTHTHELED